MIGHVKKVTRQILKLRSQIEKDEIMDSFSKKQASTRKHPAMKQWLFLAMVIVLGSSVITTVDASENSRVAKKDFPGKIRLILPEKRFMLFPALK